MKYIIKITKQVKDSPEEKYPRNEDVYEQTVEVSNNPTMYMTGTSTSPGGEITPIRQSRSADDLIKDVIRAVNEFI